MNKSNQSGLANLSLSKKKGGKIEAYRTKTWPLQYQDGRTCGGGIYARRTVGENQGRGPLVVVLLVQEKTFEGG